MIGALAALSIVAAACGGDDDSSSSPDPTDAPTVTTVADDMASDTTMADDMAMECDTPREMSVQLQWFTQAQFAGYYASDAEGFFEDHCLDVTILEGGVDIVPQTQLANGDADFAISWCRRRSPAARQAPTS